MAMMPRILAIGGSDSGGGAGIEADIKTITMLGGYAMTAITAITAQDTRGISLIAPTPPAIVARSIRMAAADIGLDAIKIGMIGTVEMLAAIIDTLRDIAVSVPIVLDPVLASTSGTSLLDAAALDLLREGLLPLVALTTPNRHEAAILTGLSVDTEREIRAAGAALCARGAGAVLIKGGHFDGPEAIDRLVTPMRMIEFRMPRLATTHTHGTGCTLGSAIAVGLGRGLTLDEAITQARAFLHAALLAAPGFGHGRGPLGHAAAR
jgi:hydroxymethylpyrimidine/phosphomethylpyrimidine kinase